MNELYDKICMPENLSAAWQRVKENKGCCGSDGITLYEFNRRYKFYLSELMEDLESGKYYPFPLMRIRIPKRNGTGSRFLSIPTIRDRVAQTAFFLAARESFEKEFETVSHAFRQGRGVLTAISEIKKWREKGYFFAVDADIDAYFDNIDHLMLIRKIEEMNFDEKTIGLLKKWIYAEIYDGEKIWTLNKGIPQGSVVSPLLANLFLDELDEVMISFGKKIVRYADDFLILSKTEHEAIDNIELTDMILEEMHLKLNEGKTKIVSFNSGFKFLGAIFLFKDVYLPFPKKRKKHNTIKFPKPLTLKTYITLRNLSNKKG